jgi:Tol biopolymer transport system component
MYQAPRLSPDGTRIAVAIRDQQRDIHVLDLRRGTFMRLAPSAGTVESNPIWTSNGERIVFSSQRCGSANNLYALEADGRGTVERLTSGPTIHIAAWVAPDGSGILGSEVNPKTAGNIVWFPFRRPASAAAGPPCESGSLPEPVVATPFIDYNPAVSPDGRYVAYQSNESGRDEIYVRPFPRVNDGLWLVSNNGGRKPAWARDGHELYYLDLTNALTAVPVRTSVGKLVHGNPSKLFSIPSFEEATASRPYDPAADGRFLVVKATGSVDRKPPAMVVVLNWFAELQAKFQDPRAP